MFLLFDRLRGENSKHHIFNSCWMPYPYTIVISRPPTKVFYATMILSTIIRPSLLLAGSFLAIGLVEAMSEIVMSPLGSLIDSAIIHFSGGDG